jgi:hypothetical protein
MDPGGKFRGFGPSEAEEDDWGKGKVLLFP